MKKRIHVVVNPASGRDRPPLEALADVLRREEVAWDISISKDGNDAARLARQAAEDGADVVAAYGGDGMAACVAGGLLGTGKHLAVLGGGTANVLATELGLPSSAEEACALACGRGSATAVLDVIALGADKAEKTRPVLLQAGMGLHARAVARAQRQQKKRMGRLVYVLGTLRQLVPPQRTRFHLSLDGGPPMEHEGVACLICNSGHTGSGALHLAPSISMRDALLDVLLIKHADFETALSLLRKALSSSSPAPPHFEHWQARRVRVETPEPQPVQGDGNIIAQTPVTARLVPSALPVVVPEQASVLRPAVLSRAA